jgi:hypothetical protein
MVGGRRTFISGSVFEGDKFQQEDMKRMKNMKKFFGYVLPLFLVFHFDGITELTEFFRRD